MTIKDVDWSESDLVLLLLQRELAVMKYDWRLTRDMNLGIQIKCLEGFIRKLDESRPTQ